MLTRRGWLVYGALFAIWLCLIGWQAAEHLQVIRAARANVVNRANNTASTLAQVVRALSNFRGVIDPERLEYALNEMVKPGEFHPVSLILLNATNGLVTSVGAPIDPVLTAKVVDGRLPGDVYWDDKAEQVMLLNLVDLGTNVVATFEELRRPRGTNAQSGTVPGQSASTNITALTIATNTNSSLAPETNASIAIGSTNDARSGRRDGGPPPGADGPGGRRGGPRPDAGPRPADTPFFFGRPYWMTQERYDALLQKKGVHGFLFVMPTHDMIGEINHDVWLRLFISALATISVAGYGLAWGNLTKTSELQIRLVRASELNSHLKEMNLAAAGLAHETRNPLNIVRGLAQMISRREDASPEIKTKTRDIIDETDRITAQLNEFINYSRPREVRRVATRLHAVVSEVVRALNYDLEEKKIQLQTMVDPMTIEADEQLLRQALFNLVLNAIQAVPAGGEIRIRTGRTNGSQAYVEVADNGPGVAPEHRTELFKPYFTTHAEGTGLGLAVVQQIVLAHGWEITCLPNQPSGAIFRVTHIKTAPKV